MSDSPKNIRSNWYKRIAPFNHDQCQERYEALQTKLGKAIACLESIERYSVSLIVQDYIDVTLKELKDGE